MTVIYAEKPSLGRTIAAALNEDGTIRKSNGYCEIIYKGENTIITWGAGHLAGLKQAKDYNPEYANWSNLPSPYIPSTFETKFDIAKKDMVHTVHNIFKNADLIINATDYDREGELIFYYVYNTMKCTVPFKRAHFSSLVPSALKESFDNLLEPHEVEPLTNAGRARSIADWVVGANLTVAITKNYSTFGVLSVGRVQTPTLKILVDREKQIREFKKEGYFVQVGKFKNQSYTGECKTRYATEKEVPILPDTGVITKITKEEQTKGAPHFYSQSTLAMACNERFGLTLEQTLNTSQELYEAAFITYPRTDSQYLTNDMLGQVNKTLTSLETVGPYRKLIDGKRATVSKYYFDDSKVQSHHAIIPTGKIPTKLTDTQKKVYDLICRNFISMLLGPATVEKTTVITEAGGVEFVTHGTTIIKAAWMEALGSPKEQILPELKEGEVVDAVFETAKRETKPPKAFTDKTLVAAMIGAGSIHDVQELKDILSSTGEKGIGTEATRAAIVETLIKRGYAERKGKTIRATDIGIALIDVIPIEDIVSPALTAKWELRLGDISTGKDNFDSFITDICNQTTEWCKLLSSDENSNIKLNTKDEIIGRCPKCGSTVSTNKSGWGCSGWKKDGTGCNFLISNKILGKKITKNQAKSLLENKKTDIIKGFKSKAGNDFDARLIIDSENKIKFSFNDFEEEL